MTDDSNITIFTPVVDITPLSDMLRTITEALVKKTGTRVGGVFGGQYGYGNEWNTDIFSMHPYCWCDDYNSCAWCYDCTCGHNKWCTVEERRDVVKKLCDWCSDNHKFENEGALTPSEYPHSGAPHFWHKSSGLKVWWYKYIGRSMHVINIPVDLSFILTECLADINNSKDIKHD